MKLAEAFDIANRAPEEGVNLKALSLVCGFTPLHLVTYLKAHGRVRFPESGIALDIGLFGDLHGNLERAASKSPAEVALILEWSDLDARLGSREGASWGTETQQDVIGELSHTFDRLLRAAQKIARQSILVVVPPTLALPPFSHTHGSQAARFELQLARMLSEFLETIGSEAGIRVLSLGRLADLSPAGTRFDVKMALASGFPYTLPHADALARLIVSLAYPEPPKKGLITDLDDTMWKGILGEAGVEGIKWDLAGHSQPHGLYQKMLAVLAENGVLIGIASKNELALVKQALEREDILLPSSSIFPIEANWGVKSSSIERILHAWNIAPDAVVFVDDSPMELAEVQNLYPGMTCLRFPANDPAGIWQLLHNLRDLFGKSNVGEEDRYRAASLKTADELRASAAGGASVDFLKRLEGRVTFHFSGNPQDARALELTNKTNQFNLNGRRFTAGEWAMHIQKPESFVVTVSYQDKFGPLGEIGVVSGRRDGRKLQVMTWVMSCRAFSRFIEHHALERLFARLDADELTFDFSPTARNQPLQQFFLELFDDLDHKPLWLTRDAFVERNFALPHTVIEDGSNREQIADLLFQGLP